jgi:hypothetical protein
MTLRWPLSLLVLLAWCATAAPGTAAVLAKEARSPAVTDGRAIAFSSGPATIRVLVRPGAVARDVDVSTTCGETAAQLSAVGAGQLLFGCGVPYRLDLASMETYEIPGAARLIEDYAVERGASFGGIGAVGVAFAAGGYHWPVDGALDWRTGEVVYEPREPTRVLDLDRPGLVTELCAPLERIPGEEETDTRFWPLQYRAPFGIAFDDEKLVLRRCGSSKGLVLSRHAFEFQLGSHLVTWSAWSPADKRDRLYVRPLACRRQMSWSVAPFSHIAPLGRSVVISELIDSADRWRIREVRLRGICRHASAHR